jgi:hypothetical protein
MVVLADTLLVVLSSSASSSALHRYRITDGVPVHDGQLGADFPHREEADANSFVDPGRICEHDGHLLVSSPWNDELVKVSIGTGRAVKTVKLGLPWLGPSPAASGASRTARPYQFGLVCSDNRIVYATRSAVSDSVHVALLSADLTVRSTRSFADSDERPGPLFELDGSSLLTFRGGSAPYIAQYAVEAKF